MKLLSKFSNVTGLALWVALIPYAGAHFLLDFDRYFDVGEVFVPETVSQDGFAFETSAKVRRPFVGSYKVHLREFATNKTLREYPESGEFEYRPTYNDAGEPVSGYPFPVGFDWWAGVGPDELNLPTGVAVIETCWTVYSRAYGLLPKVTECSRSNAFKITE